MADFRSERMPSPEGEGNAKHALEQAWAAYYRANRSANKPLFAVFPALKSALKGYAASSLLDIFGFWVMWRLNGGFEGTQKALGLSRPAMYRRIAMFREVFKEHPDVFDIPGITVDPVAFAEGMKARAEQQKSG